MPLEKLKEEISGLDIYLLDQILKGRYLYNSKILDAGCGSGRNLTWFYDNHFDVYGVDSDPVKIDELNEKYSKLSNQFTIEYLDSLSFNNDAFDHVICNAVLHFAKSKSHFIAMISELVRVLKPSRTLFIRMTYKLPSDFNNVSVGAGVYQLNDQSQRFLLTASLLEEICNLFSLKPKEPFKYVSVANKYNMCVLILQKS